MTSNSRIASPARDDNPHSQPTRRTMIATAALALAAPTAAASAAVPAGALAALDGTRSPLMALVAQWQSVYADFDEERRGHTDEEVDAFTDKTMAILKQVAETPAADMRDLNAKAEVIWKEIIGDTPGGLEAGTFSPVDHLVLSLLDDIERLAGA